MGSQQERVAALIPVRGGSKSIPLKNIKEIAGRPLVYWVARACSASRRVSRSFVATDHEEIRRCVEAMRLPGVEVIDRSAECSSDTASSESAMLEFAAERDYEHVALVQATSPLLTADDVDGALEKYLTSGADALLTVVRTKRFLWEEDGSLVRPANYDPQTRPRRQEWDGQLVENGALYVCSRKRLLETECRLSGTIAAYEMPEETYYELDEASDWRIMEQLLLARRAEDSRVAEAARNVRLFCVDVDGTLTDGGMYYTEAGEVAKRFDTRDAHGMNLLRERGLTLAIVTAEDTPIVLARARKLGIEHVHVGVRDKVPLMEKLLAELGLTWSQVAYVGDDLGDLGVLQRAGFSACPADAAPAIRAAVLHVSDRLGGHGAVRDACETILAARAAGPGLG